MPEEEVPKLKTLTVQNVDLHTKENSQKHHTNKFKTKDNPPVIFRRGQEFKMTVTFNRPYQKEKDDLVFIFDAGKSTLFFLLVCHCCCRLSVIYCKTVRARTKMRQYTRCSVTWRQ